MSGRGEDFWSRRKAAVAEAERAEAEHAAAEEAKEKQAALEEKSDEELLEELGLPDPDTLEPGDDFAAFLRAVLPERIRRRALRKLWTSNPVLANLDGLNDYDDDYRAMAEAAPGVVSTVYQVGRGMLRDLAQTDDTGGDAGDLRRTGNEEQGAPSDAAPEATPEVAEGEQQTAHEATEPAAPEGAARDVAKAEAAPVTPRRMRFQFSE